MRPPSRLCIFSMLSFMGCMTLSAQVLVNLDWEQANGALSTSIDYSVSALDASGNLIVAGNSIHATEAENFLLTKFDPEGQILWEAAYDYNDLTDFATAILSCDILFLMPKP